MAEHGGQHAGGVAERLAADMGDAGAGKTGDGEGFHRQDREHAGHQIEDQPAEKGQAQPEQQRGLAGRPRPGVDLQGLHGAAGIGQLDDAG